MFNLFPFTNFHDLNMDWIIKSIKTLWSKAVFTVNNTMPDENGNVNLPGVSGVSSVNGIGADGSGNIQLDAQDVGALPDTYTAPVKSVNNKTGNVDIGTYNINGNFVVIFVDGSAGDDNNAGYYSASPFKTIQRAVNFIIDHKTSISNASIQITAGTYNENVSAYLDWNGWLTITAYNGDVNISSLHLYRFGLIKLNSNSGKFIIRSNTTHPIELFTGTLFIDSDIIIDTNGSNFVGINMNGAEVVTGWNHVMQFVNIDSAAYPIDARCSIIKCVGSWFTSNVMTCSSNHSLFMDIGTGWTITGTYLDV